jgi:hypothetical protein
MLEEHALRNPDRDAGSRAAIGTNRHHAPTIPRLGAGNRRGTTTARPHRKFGVDRQRRNLADSRSNTPHRSCRASSPTIGCAGRITNASDRVAGNPLLIDSGNSD